MFLKDRNSSCLGGKHENAERVLFDSWRSISAGFAVNRQRTVRPRRGRGMTVSGWAVLAQEKISDLTKRWHVPAALSP
jgi:hypothetical protein